MGSLGDSMGNLAAFTARLLGGPSRFLIIAATAVLTLALILDVVLLTSPGGPGVAGSVALLALPALLAVPVVVLAVRRRRWLRAVASLGEHRVVSIEPGTRLSTGDALVEQVEEDMHGRAGEDDVNAVFDAFTEAAVTGSAKGAGARLTRILGVGRLGVIGRALARVDQAQRALLAAAGGPVAAPYLKDDLRVTLAAALGVFVAIPIGSLMAIILALVLLAR
ncbi:hypothetical protein [Occultella gossypii]|uniref:Type II secretion system protein GspF domain-containing protein n=1 Tax=Occultella gossypii TaxID=2800820 RepID=A0ABS7S4G3_9MICO|nr:hypothetical protein [Occultella gossypii]MBZ2195212.1 hypothetical protein [Occultella gossypii]